MLDRRNFMKTCSGMGLAGTLFPGVLWAQAEAQGAKKITKEMIDNAAAIADVPIADEYKEMMLESLNDQAKGYERGGGGTEEPGRFGVCERERTGGTGAVEEGFVDRPDRNVSAEAEKVRPDTEVRGDTDQRPGSRAGEEGGCGNCGREIPRTAARVAVGREGPAGGEGPQNDVGRGWI